MTAPALDSPRPTGVKHVPMRRSVGRSPLAVVALGLVCAVILAVLAGLVFNASGPATFARRVAELLLQLAVIVVLGALVKLLIDSHADLKAKLDDDNTKRADLLRRIRTEHVKVAHAQQLIQAHNSGKRIQSNCAF